MKKRFPIHRTRIGKDIVAEFAVPPRKTEQKKGRVIILAQGVPSTPTKSSLMEFLAREGFYVVFPRYRGTWESEGVFLKEEPTVDILAVIEGLSGGLKSVWTGETILFPEKPKFFLFVSSFGGPAGLLLSQHQAVRAVIAFSPVVDWTMRSKAEPMEKMFDFVKFAYGESFRMERKDFNKLGKTDFYDPTKQSDKVSGDKVLIFHAKDDESVPYETVQRFGEKHHIKIEVATRGGHYGLSEASVPSKWLKIKKFIQKSELITQR